MKYLILLSLLGCGAAEIKPGFYQVEVKHIQDGFNSNSNGTTEQKTWNITKGKELYSVWMDEDNHISKGKANKDEIYFYDEADKNSCGLSSNATLILIPDTDTSFHGTWQVKFFVCDNYMEVYDEFVGKIQ